MNTTYQNIINKFISLTQEVDELDEQIREAQQKYPVSPIKPIKPFKPDIYNNKKPNFLKVGGFIYYFIYISLPVFLIVLLFFYNREYIKIVLFICAALPLIPLYFIYSLEKTVYNKDEKRNSEILKLFNFQTKSYNEDMILYKRDILEFNEKIKRLKNLGNVQLLDSKQSKIIQQIRPLIQEIDSFTGLSATDKFLCRLLTLDYDYLREISILTEPTLTEAELKLMYEDFLKEGDSVKNEKINKAESYLKNIGSSKLNFILNLLKEVEQVQKSNLSNNEKTKRIKQILWSQHSASKKLWIGGVLGTLFGLLIFGTGGIGIAGLGGAFGIWGFLAGTTGGILISSLIQNFENEN